MAKIKVSLTIRNKIQGDEVAISQVLHEALAKYIEYKLKQSGRVLGDFVVEDVQIVAGEDR